MGSKNVFALSFSRRLRLPPLRRVLHRRLGRAGRTPGLSVAQRRAGRGPAARRTRLPARSTRSSSSRICRTALPRCSIAMTAAAACSSKRDGEALHRPSRSRRAASADHVPAFSARVGPGSTRHVRVALALLSDGGVDACSATRRSRSSPSRRRFPIPTTTDSSSRADDLPPLLHPRVLMDLDGYTAWERHMVGRCADVQERPESVLATLMRDADLLRRWRPGTLTLSEAVWELPHDVVETRPDEGLAPSLRLRDEVIAAVPDDLKPAADEEGLEDAWTKLRARGVARASGASQSVSRRKGVCVVDGVSGPRREDDRPRTGSGACARARRGGAPVPRRGASARSGVAARSISPG